MRAVRLQPAGLEVTELEVPSLQAGEALVRVHAAGITRDELTWPEDRLPAIPSYELSGVVAQVAAQVDGLGVGDEVFALTPFDRDGVAAEYAAVPAAVLAPRPESLSHVESAALPMPGLTAWQGLFEYGGLNEGELVTVVGVNGGVGHVAVQLAREQLANEGDRSDLAFDTVGGDALESAIESAGRVVSVAEEAEGATYFVVQPNRTQLAQLRRLVEAGELKPAIDSVFPLEEAAAAFARVSERGKHGKVVLRVADD